MATIVTSGCNSLTREEVIEQIQEVLKAYENRIREIRHDTDRLVPEGKDIVDGRGGAPHYATVYPFNNTNKISKNNYYPSIEVMEKM